MKNKEYLGDGVYATTNGYLIELTTEDGVRVDNTIILEPTVLLGLINYGERHLWGVLKCLK